MIQHHNQHRTARSILTVTATTSDCHQRCLLPWLLTPPTLLLLLRLVAIEEMVIHVYNSGGELRSKPTIPKRLKGLEMTKKKASIEAYQAMREDV